MLNIRTVVLAATLALSMGPAIAGSSVIPDVTPLPKEDVHACSADEYDENYPGVPAQCVKCAAPGCPSCHSERTKATVAATNDAERNCPPAVKPH